MFDSLSDRMEPPMDPPSELDTSVFRRRPAGTDMGIVATTMVPPPPAASARGEAGWTAGWPPAALPSSLSAPSPSDGDLFARSARTRARTFESTLVNDDRFAIICSLASSGVGRPAPLIPPLPANAVRGPDSLLDGACPVPLETLPGTIRTGSYPPNALDSSPFWGKFPPASAALIAADTSKWFVTSNPRPSSELSDDPSPPPTGELDPALFSCSGVSTDSWSPANVPMGGMFANASMGGGLAKCPVTADTAGPPPADPVLPRWRRDADELSPELLSREELPDRLLETSGVLSCSPPPISLPFPMPGPLGKSSSSSVSSCAPIPTAPKAFPDVLVVWECSEWSDPSSSSSCSFSAFRLRSCSAWSMTRRAVSAASLTAAIIEVERPPPGLDREVLEGGLLSTDAPPPEPLLLEARGVGPPALFLAIVHFCLLLIAIAFFSTSHRTDRSTIKL